MNWREFACYVLSFIQTPVTKTLLKMKRGAETERIHIKLHFEGSAVGVSGYAEACDLPQEGSAGGLADTNITEHLSRCIVTNLFTISSVILEWLKVTGYSQHKDNGYSN